ncbi:calcium-activated chloride channel regulator 4A-like [Amphibalanus amphitrite]|uniref:calcium-activated chloride channel regulator 4A-like n=1 Tax=Amphibalanus amphitrite TaxID=1232801 RepID=UPI001C928E51|nr:calcium-activated chloride channel regulator 4A-like [Amphibalanus amphitrite]
MVPLLVPLLAAVLSVSAAADVRLVDNVYKGLVIGIDDRLEAHRCREIIDGVQALMTEASAQLYAATNQRAAFGDVTLVLPDSWPDSCAEGDRPRVTPTESFLTSDLRVSLAHPAHGSEPWTHQTGQCGQPGAFVQMDAAFVTSEDETVTDRAVRVVQQWARYRWGVFEETGFAGDPLYPSYHRQTGDLWQPTVCSTGSVRGTVTPPGCDRGSNTCTFVAAEEAANVTGSTSLLSLLPPGQPGHLCNSSTHDRAAPTRHNLLCGERSVWEVMEQHEDFRLGSNPPSHRPAAPPITVRTARAAPDRLFFLLESSATMRVRHRWDLVSSSVRKFVNWDAPAGARVGIGHFGGSYRTDRPVTAVPESLMGRGELVNLPPVADDVPEEQKSWRQAVDGALTALGEEAAGAILFWVTGNGNDSSVAPSREDVHYMIRILTEKQTRLVVVFYPHPTRGLARVARATGGAVLSVSDVAAGALTGIGVFHELSEAYRLALRRLSRRRRLPVRVEDKEFVGGGPQVRGSFLLDDTVGGNTTLAVMYSQKTDIGYVRLQRPGGEMEPVYTYTDTTNHLQYARVEHEPGLWTYEVDSAAPAGGTVVVQVNADPAQSPQDELRLEAWTNAAATGDVLNATRTPLIIYASLMKGDAAILNAEVHAVVARPDGQRVRVKLLDNGLGEPDVQSGDGVYSRYFTDFGSVPRTPDRRLTIHVEAGGSRARVVTGRDRTVPCCGSVVLGVRTAPLPELRRAVVAGVVRLAGMPQSGDDPFPPGRITDLRAEVNPEERTVTLRWTAPGDDFDRSDGRVFRYDARYSTDRDHLRRDFSGGSMVRGWSSPQPAGSQSSATVRLDTVDGELLFLAVRGRDAAGNRGAPSNVVSFVVPPPPTTPPPPAPTTATPAPTRALLRGQSLLIVAASTAGAALLVLVLLLACCCCRRGRRGGKADRETGGPRANGDASGAYKTSMPPVTISSEVDKKGPAGVVASDGSVSQTPVMWTASDILQQPDGRPPAPDSGYGGLSASRAGSGRARYNSYQTPYGEDMVYDGRSVASSQPSDSFPSISSEARHAAVLSEAGAGWPSDRDSPLRPGLPGGLAHSSGDLAPGETTPTELPPGMKMLPTHGERSCAALSYVQGRKRRNITQV